MLHYITDINNYSNKEVVLLRKWSLKFKTAENTASLRVLVLLLV